MVSGTIDSKAFTFWNEKYVHINQMKNGRIPLAHYKFIDDVSNKSIDDVSNIFSSG